MYPDLQTCISDLENNGHLIRIREEVDPDLEMAAIHLRINNSGGPALFFEKIKGCSYPAVSNLFGTTERGKFIFRDTFETTKRLIESKSDPLKLLRSPFKNLDLGFAALKAIPQHSPSKNFREIKLSEIPQIKCWQEDGGAFITLPQVYSEDIQSPGIRKSNLGMYRIQISGNEYLKDQEAGLHYQLHRGIGIHQYKSNKEGVPLKVSIFIGGPPSHSLAAVMPLPEGIPELFFAGLIGGKRFKYFYEDGFLISSDADFVITGEVFPGAMKPEGPFGDHLGYYSLTHPFPVLKIRKVYAKKNAIYPFTVVGRPPQEDTTFGALIHELAGNALTSEIPGLIDLNAVDASGVHPLLLATGKERYTPYVNDFKPQEILTIAHRILGTGQLSLAKYLFIAASSDEVVPSTKSIPEFFNYILERIDWKYDLHFQTNTSIDTLDYSGTGLNSGSKVVIAACRTKQRTLGKELPSGLNEESLFENAVLVLPGIIGINAGNYSTPENEIIKIKKITKLIEEKFNRVSDLFPLIILTENPGFLSENLNNFLWVTFTRSNPSHDIHGVGEFSLNKHWGCSGSLVIDARIKPHHAPPLVKNEEIENKIERLFRKGVPLGNYKF